VILTPHAAFWSVEAERAVRVQAARNLDESLRS
jgi:phosphoglycerate dehydrogenase-like enzyme